ncbi:MAG: hypothetical protein A3E78_17315 [Alphaproteobacteria bacterium RIFCSPHIGHO2_12_FULL_63_12]|nr:MAG: hypothetical protein A3E78_17315 [Alphaproteobacteria bacterium RIFCSPHIGHO2_12_FULL_63_12]
MWTVTTGATGSVAASTVNQIVAITQAAANYWGRYIDTSAASIDIQIDLVDLGTTTLAQAGTDFFFAYSSGGLDFFEPATIVELTSGVDLNGAAPDIPIEINLTSILAGEFILGPLTDGVSLGGAANDFDLWTVLVHEIGHGLGLLSFLDEGGTDRSTFDQYVTQTAGTYFFDGPDPNFGPIPLDSGFSHIASSVDSLLNPSLGPGAAVYLSALDVSIFGDIGAPLKRPTAGNDDLSSFSTNSNLLSANPALHALQGDDTINGMPGNDFLFGDEGADRLYGSIGNDQLNGGDGDDTLLGDPGADSLDGGNGTDLADYSLAPSAVSVNFASSGSAGHSAGDLLFFIEQATGSAFNDTIIGSSAAETLQGGAGVDSLVGGDGADSLNGGIDNDRLSGGIGTDTLVGDNGDDTLRGEGDNDFLFAGLGHDRAEGGDGDDFVRTSNGNDSMFGAAGADTLGAGSGKDSLRGDAGDDLLLGSNGNDRIFGGADNDRIIGGNGRDTLYGETGNDMITGGAQDDRFVFVVGGGLDVITDFAAGAASGDIFFIAGYGAAIDSFAEAITFATQVGADVVFDFGAGDGLILKNVALSELNSGDFQFG